MQTRTEVKNARIQHYVAEITRSATEKGTAVGDRIQKAGWLVSHGKVRRIGPELYEVESEGSKKADGKPKVYQVNGKCDCKDGQPNAQGVSKAPLGWCKHRLGAKIQYLVEQDMIQLMQNRQAHAHRYVCSEHHVPEIDCWEQGCMDPVEIPCPICFKEAPNVPAYVEDIIGDEGAPVETYIAEPDPADATLEEACQTIIDAQTAEQLPCVREDTPLEMEPEPELPPVVYTTEEYEPAPVIGLRQEPLPEAAVSLNIKLRNDSSEVQYTMRGHTDDDVLQRLPNVLAQLERLMHSEVDHDASFLQRLTHAFFPRRKAVTTK